MDCAVFTMRWFRFHAVWRLWRWTKILINIWSTCLCQKAGLLEASTWYWQCQSGNVSIGGWNKWEEITNTFWWGRTRLDLFDWTSLSGLKSLRLPRICSATVFSISVKCVFESRKNWVLVVFSSVLEVILQVRLWVQQEFGARFFAEQFLVLWCIPKSTAHFPYSKTYVGGRLHFPTPKTSWSNSILLESHQLRPWRLDFWILFQQAPGPCKASRWPEAPDVRIEFSAEFRAGSSACGKCGASWEVGRHAIRMWR